MILSLKNNHQPLQSARPGVPRVVIALTHQLTFHPVDVTEVISAADRLKDDCVSIIGG